MSSYDDDEVRAIIEHALKAQPERSLSHDVLLSIGAGVGLSSEAIERAAEEVREARSTAAATASVVSRRRRGVAIHAFVYLLVNAFLFAINALTTPGEWWVLFPVFAWGLGLALHAGLGLSARVSPRRLQRQLRRQGALGLKAAVPTRIAERRSGVRVEGPLDSIEDPNDAELAAGRAKVR
jgi:hypothetical protein